MTSYAYSTSRSRVSRALDTLESFVFDGPVWQGLAVVLGAVAVLSAAILIPLWATGQLDKPACPKGQTLIVLPVGKVFVSECIAK